MNELIYETTFIYLQPVLSVLLGNAQGKDLVLLLNNLTQIIVL